MVTKLGRFTKLGPFSAFQLLKLSQLCYHFLSSFENKNIFSLHIPNYPVPIAVQNSLTNKFYQKKFTFLYIFNNNKKSAKLKCREGSRKNLSLFLFFLKIYRNIFFLIKMDWSMNSGQQWAGDS